MTGAERDLFLGYGVDMTEDEVFAGLVDAMSLAGWRWTHIRDSRGITVGFSGLPDIVAVHARRGIALAWEIKNATLQPTPDQLAWIHGYRLAGVDARIVRPKDYDDALAFVFDLPVEQIKRGRQRYGPTHP